MLKLNTFALLLAALLVVPTQAAFITSINGSDINTAYDSGTLTLSDTISLVIHYDNDTWTSYSNAMFQLTATLITSNGVTGTFGDGSYTIADNTSNILLSGQVQYLPLTIMFGGTILASGPGVVTLDSGALLSEIPSGSTQGNLITLLYNFNTGIVTDFSGSFEGATDASILPIPEPTSLLILGLGSLLLVGRKRS
ncbi:MAG: PEP-CTERM sorting domain-containing protein [Sedimentisphaerales bacterium]|nr:PEP-CTERM sorting domain-containing protein [Sedimentisphaerales bacterium]